MLPPPPGVCREWQLDGFASWFWIAVLSDFHQTSGVRCGETAADRLALAPLVWLRNDENDEHFDWVDLAMLKPVTPLLERLVCPLEKDWSTAFAKRIEYLETSFKSYPGALVCPLI